MQCSINCKPTRMNKQIVRSQKDRSLLFLAGLMLVIVNCSAQTTYTWTGSTSTNWNTTSNWTPAGTPGSTDTVIITSHTNNPALANNTTIAWLSITGATLTLNSHTLTTSNKLELASSAITSGDIQATGKLIDIASTAISASITASCEDVFVSTSHLNSSVDLTKTGSSVNICSGGNVFAAPVTINENGSGRISLAYNVPDTFNSTLTANNNGTADLQFGGFSQHNQYSGDVYCNVATTSSGIQISFGAGNGGGDFGGNLYLSNASGGYGGVNIGNSGSFTQAAGKTISIGSGGYAVGYCQLHYFTQASSVVNTLTFTGSSGVVLVVDHCNISGSFNSTNTYAFEAYNNTFNKLSVYTGYLYYLGSNTFNGPTSINLNVLIGGGGSNNPGGNTFNDTTLISNTGNTNLGMGISAADIFNGPVTFTASHDIYLAYGSANNQINNDLTINQISGGVVVTTSTSGSSLVFNGTGIQHIKGNKPVVLGRVVLNNSNNLQLDTSLVITDSLTLTNGQLKTNGNTLIINNGAKVIGGSSSSFVDGPVKKIGNSAFTFPIGKGSDYQPLSITAPSSSTDAFTAEYFNAKQTLGNTLDTTIIKMDTCEYWTLNRSAGSSNVKVTLGWNSNSCNVSDSNMHVSGWNGSKWKDLGETNPTGNLTAGTVTSFSPLTTYGALDIVLGTNYPTIDITDPSTGAPICSTGVSTTSGTPCNIYICPGQSIVLTGNLNSMNTSFDYWYSSPSSGITWNPNVNTNPVTATFAAGTYTINFADIASGLSGEHAALFDVIVHVAAISINITPTPTCPGTCSGTASANATGGDLSYSYSWSNGGTTQYIDGLCAGSYTVTVTDASGCTGTTSTTISAYPGITVTASAINYCSAISCSGSVSASVSGSSSPYTYSWSSGATAQTITSVCAGTYTVMVTDVNGCTGTSASTVVSHTSPSASASGSTVCSNSCDGYVTASVSGGTANYTYTWSSGTGITTSSTSADITGLCTGTYTVTITDAHNCSATSTSTATVNAVPDKPKITGENNKCYETNITYSIDAPVSGVTYSWAAYDYIPTKASAPVIGSTCTSGSTTGTGTSISVCWNSDPYAYVPSSLVVTATGADGCTILSDTLYVYPCCGMTGEEFVNTACATIIANTSVTAMADCPSGYVTSSGTDYVLHPLSSTGIHVNGTLTVNADLVMENDGSTPLTLLMGYNSKILVQSGHKLTIQTTSSSCSSPTTLKAGCDYMWDGIYVEPGAQLVISSACSSAKTVIQDAKRAVVSMAGTYPNVADFQISNTNFDLDYKGIVMESYNNIHSGTVSNCIFQNHSGGALLQPYGQDLLVVTPSATVHTYEGIEITDVNATSIGDNTSSSTKNTFENIDGYGINALRSNVEVYNNTFNNINYTGFFSGGFGVKAESDASGSKGLIVGGTGANEPNTFTNCFMGAMAQYNMSLEAKNNTMSGIGAFGIAAFECPEQTITIQGNTIGMSTTSIGSGLNTAGIYVVNVNPDYLNLTINNTNHITDAVHGIELYDVDQSYASGLGSPPACEVNNNAIDLPSSGSYTVYSGTYWSGVDLQYCNGVTADNNTITEGTATSSGMVSTIIGIDVENSANCKVALNNITNAGSGILCTDACSNSQLACNILDDCYDGLNFDGVAGYATVGDLNSGSIQQGNQWLGSVTNRLDGQQGPTTFNFNYGPGASYSPYPNSMVIGSFNFNSSGTTNDNCSNNTYPQFKMTAAGAAQNRDNQLGYIVKAVPEMSLYAEEIGYASKQYAYKHLKTHQNDLHIGIDDGAYVAFYDSVSAVAMGQFEAVQDVLHAKNGKLPTNRAVASAMNAGISPSNIMEANRKTVNDIYINKWLAGTHKFMGADYKTLYDIAKQEPVLGGTDAVYGARAMLGLDFNFLNGVNPLMLQNKKDQKAPAMSGKVYPNPNNGTMQYDYSIPTGSMGEFMIYDLSGIRVADYRLSEGENNTLKISETNLKDGIYFYLVIVNGEVKARDKLIIIK